MVIQIFQWQLTTRINILIFITTEACPESCFLGTPTWCEVGVPRKQDHEMLALNVIWELPLEVIECQVTWHSITSSGCSQKTGSWDACIECDLGTATWGDRVSGHLTLYHIKWVFPETCSWDRCFCPECNLGTSTWCDRVSGHLNHKVVVSRKQDHEMFALSVIWEHPPDEAQSISSHYSKQFIIYPNKKQCRTLLIVVH